MYRIGSNKGTNHTQKQCLALSTRIDECLDRGQIDRNEIARWSARLKYIGSSLYKAKKMKKAYDNVTRTNAD